MQPAAPVQFSSWFSNPPDRRPQPCIPRPRTQPYEQLHSHDSIDDRQGGGDTYAFEVTWQAEPNISAAPAPFFDDVRACQDAVRQRFLSQNGRGSYIDFNTFADRQGEDRDRGQGRGSGRDQGRNRGQESIQGRGIARRWNESRDLTYSCVVDTRQNQVVSGAYQYSGGGLRTDDGSNDRRQLR